MPAAAEPRFASGLTGLTHAEALARLDEVGHNLLPGPDRVPVWRRLLEQFVHFFALLLWGAALLALVGGMPVLAVAIAAVILVNGVFAFVQQHRAERATEALRDLLPARVTVLRDGAEQQVTADLVVPGDLVMLDAGDRVPADLRCIRAESTLVDTSTLTGESIPREAGAGDPLLAGCFVLQGRALAVVEATGAGTQFGRIAALTRTDRPETPLERDIRKLVRTLALIAAGVGGAFFLLMLLLGVPAADGFIFGVGVTVALVPEGLLPTVTLSLALGAQRMATQHALVRRLDSVETLGATTFICTDKTGTLTENRMNVVAVWTPGGAAEVEARGYQTSGPVTYSAEGARGPVGRAVAVAQWASTPPEDVEGRAVGDPMELAIWALAERIAGEGRVAGEGRIAGPGAGEAAAGEPPARAIIAPPAQVLAHLPFDANRRMAVGVLADRLACKGAPEAVLAACASVPTGTQAALKAMLARGLRVLAVAEGPNAGWLGGNRPHDTPRDLELRGLLGYHDPPREGVGEAIAACRRAGVRLAMITGDHPTTARAVARQIGLALPDSPVLVAGELPADQQLLAAMVDHDGVVLARATPEDKLRITQALQSRGHVVAMTGDGVNDAPALKLADIGVAMGRSGTEVAREAADLVLLDDHFATIVAAVRQGRETFLNVRRFLTYHLTDNVAELAPFVLWALSGGRIPLALGVMQILALDLGTDTLPATALGAERSGHRVLDHPPVRGRLLDRAVALRAFGILGPAEAVVEMVVFFAALWVAGWRRGEPFPGGSVLAAASGGAFLTVVVMQMANAQACRSSRLPAWRIGLTSNRFLLLAQAATATFVLLTLLVPPLARILGQAWPPAAVLPLALSGVPLLLALDALWKRRRPRQTTR
ncbi:MAG TPA: cation-transporting P-type ATPase [Candidatus Nanopelagicales bacterium]